MLKISAVVYALTLIIVIPNSASAVDWKSGLGLGFEKMQKVWNGMLEAPRMTECRLASRKVYKGKQICVYKGANQTLVAAYNDANGFCTNSMKCRYDPDSGKTIKSLVVAFTEAQDKLD